MSPQTSVANLRSPGNSPCGASFLHQGERPKLPTCAMKSRRLQKAWKGNLGFSEANFVSFLVIAASGLSDRSVF